MAESLSIVQKFFPGVTDVKDATKSLTIEVTKGDTTSKAMKNHRACAAAVACKRQEHADGVIISRAIAYLIKGKTATRYVVSGSLAREVVAFDRGGSFEPGEYVLNKPDKHIALGRSHSQRQGDKSNSPGALRHVTTNIRTVLGGRAK